MGKYANQRKRMSCVRKMCVCVWVICHQTWLAGIFVLEMINAGFPPPSLDYRCFVTCEKHSRSGGCRWLCPFTCTFLTISSWAFPNGSVLLKENCLNADVVEQIYKRNPILRHTHRPLHSPLLPLPYGDINLNRESRIPPGPGTLCCGFPVNSLALSY